MSIKLPVVTPDQLHYAIWNDDGLLMRQLKQARDTVLTYAYQHGFHGDYMHKFPIGRLWSVTHSPVVVGQARPIVQYELTVTHQGEPDLGAIGRAAECIHIMGGYAATDIRGGILLAMLMPPL